MQICSPVSQHAATQVARYNESMARVPLSYLLDTASARIQIINCCNCLAYAWVGLPTPICALQTENA